jgi:hypothetical protein
MEQNLGIKDGLPCNIPNLSELQPNRYFEKEGQGYGWCGGQPPNTGVSQSVRQAMAEAASDDLKRAATAALEAEVISPLAAIRHQVKVVSGSDLCVTWKAASPKLLSEPDMPHLSKWCPKEFMAAFEKQG